jgi:hypothetical protein
MLSDIRVHIALTKCSYLTPGPVTALIDTTCYQLMRISQTMTSSHTMAHTINCGQRNMPPRPNHTPQNSRRHPRHPACRSHQETRNLRRGNQNYRAHQLIPTPGATTKLHHRKDNPAKRANINIATLNIRGSSAMNMTLL